MFLIAGNGGSAAERSTSPVLVVAQFRPNPLPAIALTTDTSALTAIGNDYGFDTMSKRVDSGLGLKGASHRRVCLRARRMFPLSAARIMIVTVFLRQPRCRCNRCAIYRLVVAVDEVPNEDPDRRRARTAGRQQIARQALQRSAPLVDVVDADDVVLAEIAAGLHLDQFQRDLAPVGEPVNRADRDVDRLVLVHGFDARSPIVTSAVPRTTTQCSAR